jgi:hypothetical protein
MSVSSPKGGGTDKGENLCQVSLGLLIPRLTACGVKVTLVGFRAMLVWAFARSPLPSDTVIGVQYSCGGSRRRPLLFFF